MKYLVLLVAIQVCAAEQKRDCPMFCTMDYTPVCGSDGKTYSNQCGLNIAICQDPSISKAHDGSCAVKKRDTIVKRFCYMHPCPANWEPRCGSDGITYDNACVFHGEQSCKSGLKLAHMGVCKRRRGIVRQSCHNMICAAVYDPVCGSDGKTYSSECSMTAQTCGSHVTVTVAHKGPCGGK